MAERPCTTPSCAHPVDDGGFVCRLCLDHLRGDVRAVEDLVLELLVTIAREDRIGEPGRATEIPLPYRPDPAEVSRELHAELETWVRHLQGNRGQLWRPVRGARLGPLPAYRLAGPATVDLAMWIDRHLHTVSIDICGGDLVDCIAHAVARARRAVDRPDAQYLGPCSCGPDSSGRPIELYARRGAVRTTCRSCETVYDVAARREWLLQQAADMLLPAPEMSRALPALLGQKLTPSMIRGYVFRGRLVAHGWDPRDPRRRPLYRVGDVMTILSQVAAAQVTAASSP